MTQAFLIRIAMLTGVLMFGGVTWFLRQSEWAPQVEASVLPTLLWMARAVWAVAIVWYAPGVVFLVLTFIAFPARRG